MYTRLRKSLDKKDKGFTLIELLVVIVIIGILAAIAIPIFLNQRKKAVDASMKSDVRSIATAMETFYTDAAAYPAASTFTSPTLQITGGEAVRMSPNNIPYHIYLNAAGTAFCAVVANPNSSAGSSTLGYVWESDNGGLQPAATNACPLTVVAPSVVSYAGTVVR